MRDLPHDLVAAFRSTLSEARDADLLVHVVDAADERREERIAQVDAVLAEIGAGDIPQVLAFNKIDRLDHVLPRADTAGASAGDALPRERIWLSARDGAGLDLLRETLSHRFAERRIAGELQLGPGAGRLRSRLHAAGAVRAEHADEAGWRLELDMPLSTAERLAQESGGHLLHPLLLVAPSAPTYNP